MTMTFTDTGVGMSSDTVKKLFKRFSQADDGTTKSFGGTGLGLAITKELLDLMDGSIEVESKLNVGSTFTIRMPMPIDEEREQRWREGGLDDVEQLQQPIIQVERLSGINVLCVDDSNMNLKVISRPLIKAAASVTTALSAKEALDLIRVHDFDIVLTDISMPDMDGEQLQQELKSWKMTLPVFAVTGNVLKEDVARYLENGFVAALAKPLDMNKLIDVISDNVKSRG